MQNQARKAWRQMEWTRVPYSVLLPPSSSTGMQWDAAHNPSSVATQGQTQIIASQCLVASETSCSQPQVCRSSPSLFSVRPESSFAHSRRDRSHSIAPQHCPPSPGSWMSPSQRRAHPQPQGLPELETKSFGGPLLRPWITTAIPAWISLLNRWN